MRRVWRRFQLIVRRRFCLLGCWLRLMDSRYLTHLTDHQAWSPAAFASVQPFFTTFPLEPLELRKLVQDHESKYSWAVFRESTCRPRSKWLSHLWSVSSGVIRIGSSRRRRVDVWPNWWAFCISIRLTTSWLRFNNQSSRRFWYSGTTARFFCLAILEITSWLPSAHQSHLHLLPANWTPRQLPCHPNSHGEVAVLHRSQAKPEGSLSRKNTWSLVVYFISRKSKLAKRFRSSQLSSS